MSTINKYFIQLAFLTASFINEIYQLLFKRFDINSVNIEFKLIRNFFTRNNLKYIVQEQQINDFFFEINNYFKKYIFETLSINDKAIIYINNIKECENLVKHLNCLCYHEQMLKTDQEIIY